LNRVKGPRGVKKRLPTLRRSRTYSLTQPYLGSKIERVKFTDYFRALRQRPDRAIIRDEWIQRVIDQPVKELIQQDERIRRWAAIGEMDGRYLRVVLLPDGETIHNAFFDRRFKP